MILHNWRRVCIKLLFLIARIHITHFIERHWLKNFVVLLLERRVEAWHSWNLLWLILLTCSWDILRIRMVHSFVSNFISVNCSRLMIHWGWRFVSCKVFASAIIFKRTHATFCVQRHWCSRLLCIVISASILLLGLHVYVDIIWSLKSTILIIWKRRVRSVESVISQFILRSIENTFVQILRFDSLLSKWRSWQWVLLQSLLDGMVLVRRIV